MPRIVSVDVHALPIHTGQDPASLSRSFEISRDLNADLLRAVEADYTGGIDPSGDVGTSDIWQAWNNGYGVVAAGILHGATECAHVSAVQWAHVFNGTLGEGFAYWTNTAQFEEWWSYCVEHVTVCPSCETFNFDADPSDTCGNCLAPLADGHPLGVEAEEFADLVKGYMHAAIWTSLESAPQCPECDEPLTEIEGDPYWQCSNEDCDEHGTCFSVGDGGDVDFPEHGHPSPHDFDVSDLSADLLSEIRKDCADFVRANLADLKLYAEQRAYDPSEGTVWSYAGYDLYLDGARSGVGFWDRGLGELGDRLSEASKMTNAEHMSLYLDSEGVIS